jgi:hypothetical protein
MSSIQPTRVNELTDPQAQMIVGFLEKMGLPSENIIADQSERNDIGRNMQSLIAELPSEIKKDARYLSKFVIGAATGLFDYSVNAIWNEVVLNLRKKAIMYGLDIFFDSAIGGGKQREYYQREEDLASLKDSVLLDTSKKLELISDITYKKLKHMLDMRNDVGISHPTNYSINAFELMGWLKTCVSEVLNDNPTAAALQVQSFISNLKKQTTALEVTSTQPIIQKFSELPTHLCDSLLRSVFGIYVHQDTDPTVRKNISLIAPSLWQQCNDKSKYKLGVLLEGYNVNLYQEKHVLGAQFFEIVNGNAYRSESEKTILVDNLITHLKDKHNGWDNFHNEAPVAAELYSYNPDQASVLKNLAPRLFKTILMCRIGRGVNYCDGVSPQGKKYYDLILSYAGDQYAPHVISSLAEFDIQNKLQSVNCRKQAKIALEIVKTNVIDLRLNECLDYLINHIESNGRCVSSTEFKNLSKDYISW